MIQRYDCTEGDIFINNEDGSYVKYTDHQDIVDKLKADKKELINLLEIKHMYAINRIFSRPKLKICTVCDIINRMEND
jgi:hypothetical protein